MREGYNHLGDISWDSREGGRLLLPVDCFPTAKQPGSNCKTTSIAVADPQTLTWRYYVKLDPAYATRIWWNEVSPDGKLVWTSSARDLLAYSAADITAANAAPSGRTIRPARPEGQDAGTWSIGRDLLRQPPPRGRLRRHDVRRLVDGSAHRLPPARDQARDRR